MTARFSGKSCPKCGKPRSPEDTECAGCGVVFGKIPEGLPKRQMILSSTVLHEPDDFLFHLVTGLGKIKKYLEYIFEHIVGVMWNELMKGSNQLSSAGNLVAFLFFSTFAVISYYGRQYQDIFIVSLTVFWFLDYRIALFRYGSDPPVDRIHLRHAGNGEILQLRTDPEGRVDSEYRFSKDEMKMIAIECHQPRGGMFQEVMGDVWRGSLILKDGYRLLLCEDKKLGDLVRKVRGVADEYGIPCRFVDDEAGELMQSRQRFGIPEKVKADEGSFSVRSQWSVGKFFLFSLRVIHDSGFFLFFIIMTGFMVNYGKFLVFSFGPRFGINPPPGRLMIDLSYNGILSLFTPRFEPVHMVEYTIVLILMIRSARYLSRQKEVRMDPVETRVTTGGDTVTLQTGKMATPVYLTRPEPTLLLMDSKTCVKIRDLWDSEEYRSFYQTVTRGIAAFSPEKPEKKKPEKKKEKPKAD